MLLEARKPQKHWVSAPSVSTFLLQSAKNHGRTELSTFCVKSPNICLGLATPECKAFCPPKFEGQKAWISLWKAIGQERACPSINLVVPDFRHFAQVLVDGPIKG